MSKFTPAYHGALKMEDTSKFKFTPASNAGHPGPLGIQKGDKKFTPSIRGMEGRSHLNHDGYSLTWWKDNSFFKHDAMLVSAYYGMKMAWNFREKYRIPRKDFVFVADSGGFQALTQGVREEPINILKWQERNADIGFMLDIPPLDPVSLGPVNDFDFFKKCADQSHRNCDIMTRNRENEEFKFYGVLQGSKEKELDYWYKGLEEFDLDGMSLSHKPPNDPMQIALLGAYAKSKGIKNIHVLLGTGFETTPIIIYESRYFDFLTFDSSSYGVGAQLMKYNIPNSKNAIHFGRKYDGKTKGLPCNCPVCSVITIEDLQKGGSVPGALMSLHNLYIYIQRVEYLKTIEDAEEFMTYAKQTHSKKTIRALEFLRHFEEHGFEAAYRRYFRKGRKLSEAFR